MNVSRAFPPPAWRSSRPCHCHHRRQPAIGQNAPGVTAAVWAGCEGSFATATRKETTMLSLPLPALALNISLTLLVLIFLLADMLLLDRLMILD